MIDAKEEITKTIMAKIREHPVLSKIGEEDIQEVIEHLFEMQFKPDEAKTKKFIDRKITDISSQIVREETVGG